MQPTRRSVLATTLAAGAAIATGSTAVRPAAAGHVSPRPQVDPFTLGVASGDPTHDGFVLWTRLAVDPLADDGLGGMTDRQHAVQWQVATDPGMRDVVRRGVAHAGRDLGYSVHVEVQGLRPGAEYWYRFRTGRHLSAVGRAVTAPAPSALATSLTMAFASCAQYEHGYFTAYRHLAEDQPDLVLHLGDYIYEYAADTYVIPAGNVRDHRGPETETLANYRQRHAQYKTDADLQAAHAAAPWLVVWDDHEIDNNWADEVPEKPDVPQPGFLARRAAAMKAYYENMPLRRSSLPTGIDTQLYRRIQWGRLASFHMLDTRQYRSDQACGDGWRVNCTDRLDPARSITGDAQERWLLDGFRTSQARWDVLGQQVFFAERDSNPSPTIDRNSMDGWDGYVASRNRITNGWVQAGVRNPVVLTGDVHRHWAADLRLDYKDLSSPVVGSELVCTSITSTGDGRAAATNTDPMMAHNPHLRFYADLRGYVRTTITPDRMTADFRVVDRVSTPGAPVRTLASFALDDGQRGLRAVAPRV